MDLFALFSSPLTWREPDRWEKAAGLLAEWLEKNSSFAVEVRGRAVIVREGIAEIDAFIEERTARTCPQCRRVCCRWENCRYDAEDMVYLAVLGIQAPLFLKGLDEQGPCAHLTPTGCILPRHARPFRCTWHFCEALVEHMADEPQKPVRRFMLRFQELQRARQEMMDLLISEIGRQKKNRLK